MVSFALLLEELRDKVHGPQEALGRQLFEQRRAEIINAWDGELRAGVEENRLRYKVKLSWDDHGYRFTCSCGTDASRICEHVWAAVLTAREDGWFNGRTKAAQKMPRSRALREDCQCLARYHVVR